LYKLIGNHSQLEHFNSAQPDQYANSTLRGREKP
jgi:hypothetical protein